MAFAVSSGSIMCERMASAAILVGLSVTGHRRVLFPGLHRRRLRLLRHLDGHLVPPHHGQFVDVLNVYATHMSPGFSESLRCGPPPVATAAWPARCNVQVRGHRAARPAVGLGRRLTSFTPLEWLGAT